MTDKTAESMVEAHLSGIFSRMVASMVCLSDNGSELKNNQINMVLKPYRPQDNSHVENLHNFLKRTLTKFLSSSDAELDRILPFTCYCSNTAPTVDDLRESILSHPWKRCSGLLGSGNIRYLGDDKGLVLFAELHKLWLAHAKSLQENRLLKTETVKRNKNFKSHNFKVGQLIAAKSP